MYNSLALYARELCKITCVQNVMMIFYYEHCNNSNEELYNYFS